MCRKLLLKYNDLYTVKREKISPSTLPTLTCDIQTMYTLGTATRSRLNGCIYIHTTIQTRVDIEQFTALEQRHRFQLSIQQLCLVTGYCNYVVHIYECVMWSNEKTKENSVQGTAYSPNRNIEYDCLKTKLSAFRNFRYYSYCLQYMNQVYRHFTMMTWKVTIQCLRARTSKPAEYPQ